MTRDAMYSRSTHGRRAHSRGFSLTELLVAMVIGLFLLGGLVLLMVNSKKNYEQQDYNARLQENARFAMRFLSYDIRMAGFFGCSNNIINDDIRAITATDSGGGGPDEIVIAYGEPAEPGSEIVIDATDYDAYGAAETLELNAVPGDWSVGDTLVLADCGSASVAEISAITSGTQVTLDVSNTDAGNLGRIYDPTTGDRGPVTVRRLIINAYCIEAGESNIPALHVDRRTLSDLSAADLCDETSPELVEGVENIQLLYQDLGGGNFVAGSAGLPPNLAAVQLAALVRSVSNLNLDDREYGSDATTGIDLTEDAGQYTLLGQDVSGATGTIRGQRRVFNSTLAVRNRPL